MQIHAIFYIKMKTLLKIRQIKHFKKSSVFSEILQNLLEKLCLFGFVVGNQLNI